MHPGRRENRVLGLAFRTGLLVLLAGLVLLAVVLIFQGVDRANVWAGVVSAGVALAGALVTLVTWWLRQRAAARQPASTDQVVRAAGELQAAAREQWRQEAEARSLGDPDPMPVRWRLSDPNVMDHDEHIAPVPLVFSGRSDRIAALANQFRRLRRRRLVIIGGPGSGKTTLAVQLLLQLLEGWQPGESVPVLFSLVSWDPRTQPRVQDWLADQLNQTYPDLRAFGPDTAQRLADQGRLLPVLDGLDEIPANRRGEVIDALNASLHPDTGMILTSRATEYIQTVHSRDVLTAAAVIEPEPLTPDEAARYLENRLPRGLNDSWRAVLTALRNNTAKVLAEVTASPLGLWLLRTVYIDGHRDPRALIDPRYYPHPTVIQHHLLDALIPAVVRARPPLSRGRAPLRPQRHHDPDQIRRWLTTMAIELRDAQTRDWRWWQLVHPYTHQVTLVSGLMFGLVVGLTLGLSKLTDVTGAVLVGMLVGIMVGMIVGAMVSDHEAPAHADFRIRGRATTIRSELKNMLAYGLGFGLWSGGVGLLAGPAGGVAGLAFALVMGLVFGLIGFATSPSIAQRASSPSNSQRGDRRLTIFATSMCGLISVLGVGLGFWLGLGLDFGGVIVLFIALIGGPAIIRTCWPGYVAASLWLGTRRRLPWRLMEFLDEMYRLGLLRVVGSVYQFRHAALQDHLAPPRKSQDVAANPSAPPMFAVDGDGVVEIVTTARPTQSRSRP